MLVEFSVQNFRSIYKRITFSLEAVPKNEHEGHTYQKSELNLLKTSVLYGANASGKSNLFKALSFMKELVMNSSKDSQTGEEIKAEPFLLNNHAVSEPSELEIVFLIDDVLYRYGFSAFPREINKEWLISRCTKARSRDIVLFQRDKQEISIHKDFKEGKGKIQSMLRENSLFLSLLAQFNGEISSKVVKCFWDTNIWRFQAFMPMHTSIMIRNNFVPIEWVIDFLIKADIGIKGFKINEEEISPGVATVFPSSPVIVKSDTKLVNLSIQTEHEFYDTKEGKMRTVWFDLGSQESEGTMKFFSLAGLLYHTLKNGYRLFIDEIENSLHPFLTRAIVKLFQDRETNLLGAQLIFTTHSTLYLNKENFRRDEIWFTEKDINNSTDLYSLVEYKLPTGKTRKDASYGKDYISGKYGAVPFVKYSEFTSLFKRR